MLEKARPSTRKSQRSPIAQGQRERGFKLQKFIIIYLIKNYKSVKITKVKK